MRYDGSITLFLIPGLPMEIGWGILPEQWTL